MEEGKPARGKLIKNSSKKSLTREFSAGGVVFKKGDDGFWWLVTKSAPSKLSPQGFWRLPKGWLDDVRGDRPGPLARGEKKATQEEIKNAALKEVEEEGGVKAKIVAKIGTEKYFFNFEGQKTLKFVTFYLMEWKKDLPEGPTWETEKVEWLPFEKAKKCLKHKGEKRILDKAKEVLEVPRQENLI